MSLFAKINFGIFVLSIGILIVLLIPQIPKRIRKFVVDITGKIAHHKYVWPIIMAILLLLFIDAAIKMKRYEAERDTDNKDTQIKPFDMAKLFAAQRNFYLTCSNLIFLLVVWRVRHLLKETYQ